MITQQAKLGHGYSVVLRWNDDTGIHAEVSPEVSPVDAGLSRKVCRELSRRYKRARNDFLQAVANHRGTGVVVIDDEMKPISFVPGKATPFALDDADELVPVGDTGAAECGRRLS